MPVAAIVRVAPSINSTYRHYTGSTTFMGYTVAVCDLCLLPLFPSFVLGCILLFFLDMGSGAREHENPLGRAGLVPGALKAEMIEYPTTKHRTQHQAARTHDVRYVFWFSGCPIV